MELTDPAARRALPAANKPEAARDPASSASFHRWMNRRWPAGDGDVPDKR